ncbi:MAG: ATP-binding cassette domain-containing protein [Anaerolineaceae bacterium]|nr:ATP-binding cassette domain-containing protein [Anaerolineaceae bacterium]
MSNSPSIETECLWRIYKIRGAKQKEPQQLVALENVNLTLYPGETFGLLGPNGAGKTTLIKILTTLLAPSRGCARVAGFDVIKEPDKVRQRINMVSGGESSGYGLLTVRENLWMFAQFYGIPSAEANQRIRRLLEIVGLSDRMNTKSTDLSTGLRQKMNIVRGFLTDPQVLFLDEPTLGLDVGASRDVRGFIHQWVAENPQRTLLLTTHYLVEAEELCNRVAIINKGKLLACDTPANLKQALVREAVFEIQVYSQRNEHSEHSLDEGIFKSISGMNSFRINRDDGKITLHVALAEEAALAEVIAALTRQQARILNLQKREPTLEDVFVHLVGARMEEVEQNADVSTINA